MKLRMMAAVLALPLMLMLAGCPSMQAETPAQHVFALQSEYNGLLAVALAYESQARCSDVQPQPCSDADVVAEIRKADNDAWAAILSAQEYVRAGHQDDPMISQAAEAAAKAVGLFTTILTNHHLIGG